jgi:hypothetical protein
MSCTLVDVCRSFGVEYLLHLQGSKDGLTSRSEVLTAVTVKSAIICDVIPYSLVEYYRCFSIPLAYRVRKSK